MGQTLIKFNVKKRVRSTGDMKNIVEIFNYEINKIRSTNGNMQNYIDSCHRKSEIRVAYLEQSTAYFKKIVNTTIKSDSIIQQEKQNGSKKDRQENPYDKNEAKKSIKEIASKKIEQDAIKTIEKNASKIIDFKTYLDNLIQETNLPTTPLGKVLLGI